MSGLYIVVRGKNPHVRRLSKPVKAGSSKLWATGNLVWIRAAQWIEASTLGDVVDRAEQNEPSDAEEIKGSVANQNVMR